MSKIIKLSKLSQGPSNILKRVKPREILNIKLRIWGDGFRELKILHSKRFLCIPPLALIISNGLWAVSWIESLSIIVLSITGDRTSLKKLLWSLSPVMPMLFPRPNTTGALKKAISPRWDRRWLSDMEFADTRYIIYQLYALHYEKNDKFCS